MGVSSGGKRPALPLLPTSDSAVAWSGCRGGCIIAAVRSGWQKTRPIAVFADGICTAQPAEGPGEGSPLNQRVRAVRRMVGRIEGGYDV